MKGSSLNASSWRNHSFTSVTLGSSRTPFPTFRIRTSSPSNRNSFGKRTAWLRPLRNNLAVVLISPSTPYFRGPKMVATKSIHQIPPSPHPVRSNHLPQEALRRPIRLPRKPLHPLCAFADPHPVRRKLRRKRVRHQRIPRAVMHPQSLPAPSRNCDHRTLTTR